MRGSIPLLGMGGLRGIPSSLGRRRRPGAAATAFTHALTILRDSNAAEEVASTALRRGAQSRVSVMAHARHETLDRAAKLDSPDADLAAAAELRDLARQLAATRPAVEWAITDLELRYGLDSISLARVLGLTPSRTTERIRTATTSWAETLDPAMMGWLGPGSCDALAGLLTEHQVWPRSADSPVVSSVDTTGPIPVLPPTGTDTALADPVPSTPVAVATITVGALLETAPTVYEHAQNCEVCSERLRMLTPVRALVGQLPVEEVPESVASIARAAKRRLPSAMPPSIEPRRIDPARFQVPIAGVVAALVAVLALVGIVKLVTSGEESQESRVAKLVEEAPMSRLLATPTIITPGVRTAALANNGTSTIEWEAKSSAPWLTLKPERGKLAPSQSISIAVSVTTPPKGVTDAVITVTGSDGSRQSIRYDTAGG